MTWEEKKHVFFKIPLKICYGIGMSLKNLEHDLSNIHNGSEFYVTLLSGNQFLNKHLSLGGKT